MPALPVVVTGAEPGVVSVSFSVLIFAVVGSWERVL